MHAAPAKEGHAVDAKRPTQPKLARLPITLIIESIPVAARSLPAPSGSGALPDRDDEAEHAAAANAAAPWERVKQSLSSFVDLVSRVAGGAFRSIPRPSDFRLERRYRARIAGAAAPETRLPETYDLRSQLLPIRNQGELQGTCVAQCVALWREWNEWRRRHNHNPHDPFLGPGSDKHAMKEEAFSPQFVYNLRSDKAVAGMAFREAARIAQKHGIPHEKLYPYGCTDPPLASAAVRQDAARHRAHGHGRLSTVETLKLAIWKNGPCFMFVPCYNNLSTQMWIPDPANEEEMEMHRKDSAPGHCMAPVGWTRDSFILRNSWGTGFGNAGYALIPFSHWQPDKVWEAWTLVDRTRDQRDTMYAGDDETEEEEEEEETDE